MKIAFNSQFEMENFLGKDVALEKLTKDTHFYCYLNK